MAYRYETHCHSAEGSACSRLSVTDLVHLYRDHGYAGLVLTNHFTGNFAFENDISWRDRVNRYFDICEDAAEVGKTCGVQVFPGMEHSAMYDVSNYRTSTGTDFLVYGLSREWWLDFGGAFTTYVEKDLDVFRAAGAYVIQAHPFAEARHIDFVRLLPRHIDAVEVVNGCKDDETNARALWFARSYGLAMSGGSDTHRVGDGHRLCGVETDAICENIFDLIEAIRSGNGRPFAGDKV